MDRFFANFERAVYDATARSVGCAAKTTLIGKITGPSNTMISGIWPSGDGRHYNAAYRETLGFAAISCLDCLYLAHNRSHTAEYVKKEKHESR